MDVLVLGIFCADDHCTRSPDSEYQLFYALQHGNMVCVIDFSLPAKRRNVGDGARDKGLVQGKAIQNRWRTLRGLQRSCSQRGYLSAIGRRKALVVKHNLFLRSDTDHYNVILGSACIYRPSDVDFCTFLARSESCGGPRLVIENNSRSSICPLLTRDCP